MFFADTTEQQSDFRPVSHGVMFGPLQDPAMFNAVTIDSEAGTLVWPNGADFDPATLHDWPDVSEELAARAWLAELAGSSGLTGESSRRAADPYRRVVHSKDVRRARHFDRTAVEGCASNSISPICKDCCGNLLRSIH